MSSEKESRKKRTALPPRKWSISQNEMDRIRQERSRHTQLCTQCNTTQKPIPEFEFHEHGPMMACPRCRPEFF